MNIRRKRVRNTRRPESYGVIYDMRRDIDGRTYAYSVAFTELDMEYRAFVARRLMQARRELREYIKRERMA